MMSPARLPEPNNRTPVATGKLIRRRRRCRPDYLVAFSLSGAALIALTLGGIIAFTAHLFFLRCCSGMRFARVGVSGGRNCLRADYSPAIFQGILLLQNPDEPPPTLA